jgi:hypothetical protein
VCQSDLNKTRKTEKLGEFVNLRRSTGSYHCIHVKFRVNLDECFEKNGTVLIAGRFVMTKKKKLHNLRSFFFLLFYLYTIVCRFLHKLALLVRTISVYFLFILWVRGLCVDVLRVGGTVFFVKIERTRKNARMWV